MATITHPSRLDTRKTAKAIQDWLDEKGFETKAFDAQGAYTIKARKGSAVRAVVGADRALEVEVRHAGSQTVADVRQGSWKTNIVSNAVWLVATGGMNLAVSGWSVVIQKDLESYIRSLFAELGGVHMVDLTDGAAVRQGQLACNLSDVPAENTNLFPCPDCGNSVSRFAAACPQCGRPVALTPEQRAEQQERERQLAAERERLAREEQERQRERAERLAVQRQRQHEEELERQHEVQRQWEERKRQWEEWKRKALRWGEERSRATLVAVISVARWVLRRGDKVLRALTRHRRDVWVRRVLVPARRWGRKVDRALRGWSSRLRTLNEAGMRRCLWLVLAVALILAIAVGALAVNGVGGKRAESVREQERRDREIQSPAAAPDSSGEKGLTAAQKEQIRLRLQALYAALYSLPASVPLDQGPAVMQQEANLRAQIGDLEAQLADPSHPAVSSEPKAAGDTHPSPAPTASDSTEAAYPLPTGWVRFINRATGLVLFNDRQPLRIEPAGDCFKLRCKPSGQFLAIRDWAKNRDDATDAKGQPLRLFRHVPASDDPSMRWEIRPVGNGFYIIANRASGKCLEFRTEKLVRQSVFREGAVEQQWRIEPVKSGE